MFTPMVAGLPNGMEWVILLVVALLLFGGSRLAGLGRGTGRAIREFKEETQTLRDKEGDKDADKDAELEGSKSEPATADQAKSEINDAEVVESRTETK